MKYLITGITGFLGPHLANKLIKEGHDVYGLVRINNGRENDIRDIVSDEYYNKITFLYGDLTDYRMMVKNLSEHMFDGIFHLAAQTHPPTSFLDPIKTWEWNVMGSVNLITVLQDIQPKCKLLFCSTVEVYGNEGVDGRKIKEDNTLLPANPYGASKAAIDLYLQERMKNGTINCAIVRPFCFTGPRRGSKFSISSDAIQIARMMLGKQEKVLKIGNLDTVRIVADVRDVANAFYIVMMSEKSSGNIYNVCSGSPYKMRHYTETLIKLSGLEGVTQEIEPKFWRPIDIMYQDGDSSKLEEELGWKPEYTIDETLKDLLDYWVAKIK